VSNRSLAQVRLVHVDVRLQALLPEHRDLSNLLEDHGLVRLVAVNLESGRVVSAVLHALETVDEGVEDETAVPLAEEGGISEDAAPGKRGRMLSVRVSL
jgi:hypothetical protein